MVGMMSKMDGIMRHFLVFDNLFIRLHYMVVWDMVDFDGGMSTLTLLRLSGVLL